MSAPSRSVAARILATCLAVAATAACNASSAQITSTTAGGDWWESTTWIGGTVPTATDDVTVQGPVVVARDDVCRNLTITAAGSIRDLVGGAFQENLLVNGDVDNAGVVEPNSPSGLAIRVVGDLINRGTWRPSITELEGGIAQTISTVGGALLESVWHNDDPEVGISLGSDVTFGLADFRLRGGRLNANGYTIVGDSTTYLNGGTIVGPVTLDGRHSLPSGIVFEGVVTNNGILEAYIGGSFIDAIEIQNGGTLINNGTIRNALAQFTILVDGTVDNRGFWETRSTKFIGLENYIRHESGSPLGGEWNAADSSVVTAESPLTFSAATVSMQPGFLDMDGHPITLTNETYIDYTDVSVDSIAFFDRSKLWRSNIFGDLSVSGSMRVGAPVVVEGSLVVADSLFDSEGNFAVENIEVGGTLWSNGVTTGSLDISATGDVIVNGPFSPRRLVLSGSGPRNVSGVDATSAFVLTDGPDVALTGTNVLPQIAIDFDGFARITDGHLVIPEGGLGGAPANLENFARITMYAAARANDRSVFYDSSVRTGSVADFDSIFVETHGNQTPRTFGAAVRNWWRVYTNTGEGNNLTELILEYDNDHLGDNDEDSLEVYASEDGGQSWRQVSGAANLTRDPDNNRVTIVDVASNAMYLLSSTADPISVAPNIVITLTGRDVIRVGAPLLYTYTYTNASRRPTGDMIAVLALSEGGHISKIITGFDDEGNENVMLPADFAVDELPSDSAALLWINSMEPGETRTFGLEAWADRIESASSKHESSAQQFEPISAGLTIVAGVALAEVTQEVVDFKSTQLYQWCRAVRMDYDTYGSADWDRAWQNARYEASRLSRRSSKLASASRLYSSFQAVMTPSVGSFLAKRFTTNIAKCIGELGIFVFDRVVARPYKKFTDACDYIRRLNKRGGQAAVQACPGSAVFTSRRELEPVTSLDPNEKHGPAGSGSRGYLSEVGRIDYTIYFENLATAGAAAYRITIDDTLDADFDASTVELGPSSHPGFTFVQDGPNLRWEVVGIELPPNVNPPEGEGFVSFSVHPREGLATGDALSNRASIVFDLNDAILTNTHINTLDLDAPSTDMLPFSAPLEGDSATVRWLADDGSGSGISHSSVFVSIDDGPFLFAGTSAGDSIRVETPTTGTYSFYALAVDSVGNAESTRPAPVTVEVTAVGVDEVPAGDFRLSPAYPNPFSEVVTLDYVLGQPGRTTVSVFDVLGRRVAVLRDERQEVGPHQVVWKPEAVASGVYYVVVALEKQRETVTLVRLR